MIQNYKFVLLLKQVAIPLFVRGACKKNEQDIEVDVHGLVLVIIDPRMCVHMCTISTIF